MTGWVLVSFFLGISEGLCSGDGMILLSVLLSVTLMSFKTMLG